MYWLISLVCVEIIIEAFICKKGYDFSPTLRRLSVAFVITLLIFVSTVAILYEWRLWLWGLPIIGYRVINLLRIYYTRLPVQYLRTVCQRTFWWLFVVQAIIGIVAVITHYWLGREQFINILLVVQLLSAIILLRISTNTWYYSTAPTKREPLTDKRLPSVSVLVPARNETEDLEICLQALVASDYPKLEILVLDDCSSGRQTPDIIRSFAQDGVRFIHGQIPDEVNWLAKNYAYEQLRDSASGEILLFCGVDAVISPKTIRLLVEELESSGKDMLSVLPLRRAVRTRGGSLLQSMRYFWEVCLPRRFFRRPPVLSTCWLIRSTTLNDMGGFESVRRSVTPEAPLARRAVANDKYSFIRSDDSIGVYSDKGAEQQYETSIRVRYPQLHRRLELIALASLAELILLLGPFIGLFVVVLMPRAMACAAIWGVSIMCLYIAYGIVVVGSRLTNPWYGWLLMPVGFMVDLVVLHVSLWKYEFSNVEWKGRNVCVPVMRLEQRQYPRQ